MADQDDKLKDIAQKLIDANKKVQLIYAFNGAGKTRLSRVFKELVASNSENNAETTRNKILYYNAFTEDLFTWENDLQGDDERFLRILPNAFTDWVLRDQGQDQNIVANFQHYTTRNITPTFEQQDRTEIHDGRSVNVATFLEVRFSI